jgi:hypothetical protein
MATSTQLLPIFPAPPRPPPEGWTQDYGNQLNRWLENLSQFIAGINYVRASGLYLAPGSFPTSGYGLRAGEVFSNAGILTVVREGDIWMGSFAIGSGLGTLTVSV